LIRTRQLSLTKDARSFRREVLKLVGCFNNYGVFTPKCYKFKKSLPAQIIRQVKARKVPYKRKTPAGGT
jgi:hypothetical protein